MLRLVLTKHLGRNFLLSLTDHVHSRELLTCVYVQQARDLLQPIEANINEISRSEDRSSWQSHRALTVSPLRFFVHAIMFVFANSREQCVLHCWHVYSICTRASARERLSGTQLSVANSPADSVLTSSCSENSTYFGANNEAKAKQTVP